MARANCCCGCQGLGQPFLKTWLDDRESWANETDYVVGDLVLIAASSTYHVCKLNHTSDLFTNDPITDTGNTYWEDAERQLNCMYVELSGIGMADCRPLWNTWDFEVDPATQTGLVRLDEVSGSPPTLAEKWLLRQKRKPTHPDLLDGLGTYSDKIGESCHWFKKCNCSGSEVYELVFATINAVNHRFVHRQDSAHTDYIIQVNILSATELEVVIYGFIQFMRSSAWDGIPDREDPPAHPPTTSDTPCKYASAPSMVVEVFRGTGTIPANWIDNLGEPVSNIVVSNDYACGDIGTRLFQSDLIATNDIWVAGGGGTVTIKPPFTDPWTPGDSLATCTAIAAPSDTDCGNYGGDPPIPPPVPPPPPRCPNPPCDGGPGPGPDPPPDPPLPKRKWRKVNYCDGGFTGFWVPDGGYPRGTVLKVALGGGDKCVVIGEIKVSESPPGPLLGGVLSNYGQRGCRECLEHWDFTPCDGGDVRHTDNDLSAYEGQVVKVDGDCGTVGRAAHEVDTEDFTPGEEFEDCDECECPGIPPDELPAGDPPAGYASSYTMSVSSCADCVSPCSVTMDWNGFNWGGAAGTSPDISSASLTLDTVGERWYLTFVCDVPGGDNDASWERVCEDITGTYELLTAGHDFGDWGDATVS